MPIDPFQREAGHVLCEALAIDDANGRGMDVVQLISPGLQLQQQCLYSQ